MRISKKQQKILKTGLYATVSAGIVLLGILGCYLIMTTVGVLTYKIIFVFLSLIFLSHILAKVFHSFLR